MREQAEKMIEFKKPSEEIGWCAWNWYKEDGFWVIGRPRPDLIREVQK